MKQVIAFLFILLLGFAPSLNAQVTTTLAADGTYKVNKSDATTLFNLTSDASGTHQLRLPNSTARSFQILNPDSDVVFSFGDLFSSSTLSSLIIGDDAGSNWLSGSSTHIQLHSESIANNFAFVSYSGSNAVSNEILAYTSRGSRASRSNVVQNDILLNIESFGRNYQDLFKSASSIQFVVDTSTLSYVPGRIDFITGTRDAAPTTRMTIKRNGNVGVGTPYPNSTFHNNGSFALNIKYVFQSDFSANTYELTDSDYTIIPYMHQNAYCDVELPDPTDCPGRVYVIKNGEAVDGIGVGVITIDSKNSEKIDGHAYVILDALNEFVVVQAVSTYTITGVAGGVWYVIGGNGYTYDD